MANLDLPRRHYSYSQVGMSENVTPSEGTLETYLFYYIMNTFAL